MEYNDNNNIQLSINEILWKCILEIIKDEKRINNIENVHLLCLISLYDWSNVNWSNSPIRESIKNVKLKLYVFIIIVIYIYLLDK